MDNKSRGLLAFEEGTYNLLPEQVWWSYLSTRRGIRYALALDRALAVALAAKNVATSWTLPCRGDGGPANTEENC